MAPPTHFTLNNGMQMPALGLGTYSKDVDGVGPAVAEAIKMGYRHLDCARFYPTESAVGDGIKLSGIDRSELFLTSKVWNTNHRPAAAAASLDASLAALQTDYLDLLLIHWPLSFRPGDDPFPVDAQGVLALDEEWSLLETWRGFEALVDTGKVKAIGVSNFMPRHLDPILKNCRIKPVVNQVECHVWEQQAKLLEYCKGNEILLVAYAPLGHIGTINVEESEAARMTAIATKAGLDPAQLMLSFHLQRGIAVLPKSWNAGRMKTNMHVFDVPESVMEEIKALDKGDAGRQHGAHDFHRPYPEWVEAYLKFE
ncbi:aldehyde reductase 1 [Geopyxis carbonaria]|nr:aldehyde reductase 1 [Geopyxis carbonaria]